MRDFKSSPSFSHHRKKNFSPLFLSLLTIGVAGVIYWFFTPPNADQHRTTTANNHKVTVPLKLPTPIKANDANHNNQSDLPETLLNNAPWEHYQVRPGDSLSRIFTKLKLDHRQLHQLLASADNKTQFRLLRPGESLRYLRAEAGKLSKFAYAISPTQTRMIQFGPDVAVAETITKKTYKRTIRTSGVIKSSLVHAGKKSGLSSRQILALANIFEWDIDFALDLRVDDQFSAVIEEQTLDDGTVVASTILAAEFTNRGTTHRAIRYTDPNGNTAYYTPDGKSLKKTFLRGPVKFARVSSRFNLKRKHPILNKIRAHKGVDYAAATGTPIRATGDGRIIHRARKGGYGRTVILQHGNRYSTLYAHLSKYKGRLKKGTFVKQGQIIGYVGMSGLATGPHLHYEFRVNGLHKNPLTVKLPKSQPINADYYADFLQCSKPLLAQLDLVSKDLLASNP